MSPTPPRARPNPWDFFATRKPALASESITKRELFAAMAMQGLLACPGEPSSLSIAELSVIHADALISELSKGTES